MVIKGVRIVEEQKKIATTSKIVGALVESEANALEALEILERAKQTFLERCWHVSSNKKSPQVARTTSEEKNNGHSVGNKPYQDGIANVVTGRKKYEEETVETLWRRFEVVDDKSLAEAELLVERKQLNRQDLMVLLKTFRISNI